MSFIDRLTKGRIPPVEMTPAEVEESAIRDREARGRSGSGKVNSAKTHCPKGHEYTPENTRVRRGMRNCVTCHRERDRARYAANRSG